MRPERMLVATERCIEYTIWSRYALLVVVRGGTLQAGLRGRCHGSHFGHSATSRSICAMRPLGVLTHLLTTTLDDLGRERTAKPGEQGQSDSVDVAGRL